MFIAVELRQNSESVKSQTRAQISIAYADLIDSQRSDDVLLQAISKMRRGEDLSELERMKVDYNVAAHMRLAENSHYQYRQGNYSEEEYAAERGFWKRYFAESRARRQQWDRIKPGFSEAFQKEVEEFLNDEQAYNMKLKRTKQPVTRAAYAALVPKRPGRLTWCYVPEDIS